MLILQWLELIRNKINYVFALSFMITVFVCQSASAMTNIKINDDTPFTCFDNYNRYCSLYNVNVLKVKLPFLHNDKPNSNGQYAYYASGELNSNVIFLVFAEKSNYPMSFNVILPIDYSEQLRRIAIKTLVSMAENYWIDLWDNDYGALISDAINQAYNTGSGGYFSLSTQEGVPPRFIRINTYKDNEKYCIMVEALNLQ